MSDRRPGAQMLPVEPRNRAARTAVHHLSNAQLISEREAVSALEDIGATEEEVDLVRGIAAVVRRRV